MGSPEETLQIGEPPVNVPLSTSGSDSESDAQSDNGQPRDTEQASASNLNDLESNWRGWVCVLGSFLFLVPSFGFMNSLGTVQTYLSLNQLRDYSTGDIGWISGVYLFLSLLLNVFVGPVFDARGPKILGPAGVVGVIAMFFLMAECSTYVQFMLCLGVFGSIGSAMTMVVAVSVVGKLFVRHRGLAMGIALTGGSLGAVIFPLMLRSTFTSLGWKWSLRIMGFIATGLMVPGMFCFLPYLRHRPSDNGQKLKGSVLNLGAFRNPAFDFVSAGMFCLEFTIFALGALLPTLATGAGFSPEDGFVLIAIIGAASCVGRIIPGLIGDRIGHFNVILIMAAITIVFMGTMFVPFGSTSAEILYAFSALWGFGSGSFLSITPVCLGKTCEAKEYGTYYGTMNLVVAFSLLISLPLSGMMLDSMGAQALAGLYIAVIFLAGVCFFAARALLVGEWLSLRSKI